MGRKIIKYLLFMSIFALPLMLLVPNHNNLVPTRQRSPVVFFNSKETAITSPRYQLTLRGKGTLYAPTYQLNVLMRTHDTITFRPYPIIKAECLPIDKSISLLQDMDEFSIQSDVTAEHLNYNHGRTKVFIGICPYINSGKKTAMIMARGDSYKLLIAAEGIEASKSKHWLENNVLFLLVN